MSGGGIRAAALRKHYGGVAALDGLSLEVAPGAVVCLLGGNGAGKTTFIDLCLGFGRADAGELRVAGLDPIADPIAVRAACAFLPEQVALYDALSGQESLVYFAALAGLAAPSAEACGAQLSAAGLAPEAQQRRVATYSKGMRQRLALAIALARGARVALLDEPTTGLDQEAVAGLAGLLRELAGRGVAVLVATHDLAFAAAAADAVVFLRRGRALAQAAPGDPRGLARLYAETMAAAA